MDYWGGGGNGYIGPPLKLLGGGGRGLAPLVPPLPTPMKGILLSDTFYFIILHFRNVESEKDICTTDEKPKEEHMTGRSRHMHKVKYELLISQSMYMYGQKCYATMEHL